MENRVTFDTAKRLKEAGFPQPTPQVGQFWYQEYTGKLTIIYEVQEGQVYRHNIPPGKGSLSAQCDLTSFLEATIFAPTATDILQLLPSDLSLRFENFLTKYFYIESFEKTKGIRCGGTMNAAEVCASEFFRMKEEAQ